MEINSLLKEKNILVTGGAGFIGSNLCAYLLKCNANVVCLDNFSTGYKKNIKLFFSNKRFKLIEGDIRHLNICQKACKGIDYVLHQAALGSVPRSIENPYDTNAVNISGFLNMLIASRDNKIKRFIFAASSSTYGDSKNLPKIEEEIGSPLSPYAITKYVNEMYAKIFKMHYDLDFIGLRYFNVFGPKQDPNGAYAAVIPKFIQKFIFNDDLTINGDGYYSRDFTYIDNIIQINILSLLTENKSALNQVYNSAAGEKTSLNELVNIIKKNIQLNDLKINDINIIYGPIRKGDIPHSLACINKAKDLLNYNPSHNINEGISESISWYFKNIKK